VVYFLIKDLFEYKLRTPDETLGAVKDAVIDQQNWVLRYLITEIDGQNYLLSTYAFGLPDSNARTIPVSASRRLILESPTVDVDNELTREVERQFSDYYQWPYYWEPDEVPETQPGDLTAIPLIEMELDRQRAEEEMMPETSDENLDERSQASTSSRGGSNLRRVGRFLDNIIYASNDERNAGKLQDFIIRDEDWSVLYMVVETGTALDQKNVLVSPDWVQWMDQESGRVQVELTEDTIRESPPFTSINEFNLEYQDRHQNPDDPI
jgi:hypothetical protein